MSYDQVLVERSGYTILDILSDVGGLQGILTSGILLLLSILNHSYLDTYLASKLFKVDEIAIPIPSMSESIKEFCIKMLPRRVVCCQKNRKQLDMDKALAVLEKEVDIVKLIRSRRFMNIALKHLLGPTLHKELKARSKFHEIKFAQEELSSTNKDDKEYKKRSLALDVSGNASAFHGADCVVEMIDHHET